MNLAYRLDKVAYLYGNSKVLDVESLDIARGERVAIIGPNGSGKTTLLHLLAFVGRPSQGRIFLFGEECTPKIELRFRRRVGLLTQNPYLFTGTVMDNVQWGLKIRGVPAAIRRKLALVAIRSVGLDGFENRRAQKLSGGESQRVALARILVLEPEVLLLDEPGNHMDKASIELTEKIVLRRNVEKGTTLIFTTHNMANARSLATRVLTLQQGQTGTGLPGYGLS
jgi:tungstate transport system ATP-binding protein